MAQPTAYNKSTDFAADERNNAGGRSTVRTDRVDAEFSAIATTLRETLANLALLQRDDGKIRDGIVELYHLSTACRAALGVDLTPRGLWATDTEYAAYDLVDFSGTAYLCPTDHTSGDFAADYAAGLWQAFANGDATAASVDFTPPSTMTATDVDAAIKEVNTMARKSLPFLACAYGAL